MPKGQSDFTKAAGRLGLSPDQAQQVLEFKWLGEHYHLQCFNILGGAMTKACILVQSQLEEIEQRLKDVRVRLSREPLAPNSTDSSPRRLLLDEEDELLKNYVATASALLKMFEASQEAIRVQATVRNWAHQPTSPGRPGFSAEATD